MGNLCVFCAFTVHMSVCGHFICNFIDCEYFCFIYSENTKVSTAPPGGVNDWIFAFLLN